MDDVLMSELEEDMLSVVAVELPKSEQPARAMSDKEVAIVMRVRFMEKGEEWMMKV